MLWFVNLMCWVVIVHLATEHCDLWTVCFVRNAVRLSEEKPSALETRCVHVCLQAYLRLQPRNVTPQSHTIMFKDMARELPCAPRLIKASKQIENVHLLQFYSRSSKA